MSGQICNIFLFAYIIMQSVILFILFQVKVLELEQALEQERFKLGALRKKHYELAGVKEEAEAEETTPVKK